MHIGDRGGDRGGGGALRRVLRPAQRRRSASRGIAVIAGLSIITSRRAGGDGGATAFTIAKVGRS